MGFFLGGGSMAPFVWKAWSIPARNQWRRWTASTQGSLVWGIWATHATWTQFCSAFAACHRLWSISSQESIKQSYTSKLIYSSYLYFSAWHCHFPSKGYVLPWECPRQPPTSSPPGSYSQIGHRLVSFSFLWNRVVSLLGTSSIILCHFDSNTSYSHCCLDDDSYYFLVSVETLKLNDKLTEQYCTCVYFLSLCIMFPFEGRATISSCFTWNLCFFFPRENGESATAFGSLISDMWLGEFDCVSPEVFHSVLGKRYPTFSKRTQQDAQEFLICVLNELHEGLKKVRAHLWCSGAVAVSSLNFMV